MKKVLVAVLGIAAGLLAWRTVEKQRVTEDLWAEAERLIK